VVFLSALRNIPSKSSKSIIRCQHEGRAIAVFRTTLSVRTGTLWPTVARDEYQLQVLLMYFFPFEKKRFRSSINPGSRYRNNSILVLLLIPEPNLGFLIKIFSLYGSYIICQSQIWASCNITNMYIWRVCHMCSCN
jgi:hypothetical protein